MRSFLVAIALAMLLLAGAPVWTLPASAQSESGQPSQQQTKATKTVAGKVTSIGNNGTSFALEVNSGSAPQTLQFVLDGNTKVQGTVKVGTPVVVEYAMIEGGQNLAVSVTAQG